MTPQDRHRELSSKDFCALLRRGSKSPTVGQFSREAMSEDKATRPRQWRSFFLGMAIGFVMALAWKRRGEIQHGKEWEKKRSRRTSKRSIRSPTIEVTLQEGQTLGDVVVKYVGDFTQENLNKVLNLNKVRNTSRSIRCILLNETVRKEREALCLLDVISQLLATFCYHLHQTYLMDRMGGAISETFV